MGVHGTEDKSYPPEVNDYLSRLLKEKGLLCGSLYMYIKKKKPRTVKAIIYNIDDIYAWSDGMRV